MNYLRTSDLANAVGIHPNTVRMLSRAGYSLAAILRMLTRLDRGDTSDLRRALDTPQPDEDVYMASDRWMSTLIEQEERARQIITLVEELIRTRAAANP